MFCIVSQIIEINTPNSAVSCCTMTFVVTCLNQAIGYQFRRISLKWPCKFLLFRAVIAAEEIDFDYENISLHFQISKLLEKAFSIRLQHR